MKSPKLNLQVIGNSERIIATKNNAGFTPSKYYIKDNVKVSEKLNGTESGNKSMNPLEGVSPSKNNQNHGLTIVDNSENIKKMINEHNQKLMQRMRSGSQGRKSVQEPESADVRPRAPSVTNVQNPTGGNPRTANTEKKSPGVLGIPRAPKQEEKQSIWSKAGKFVKTRFSFGSKSDNTDPNSNPLKPNTQYMCDCNSAPEFARIKTDSTICCARTFSWLNRRYSPYNLEGTLQKYFDDTNFSLLDKDLKVAVHKDVVRTFSANAQYKTAESKSELQSLLMVFITQYPEIGYVQGMNYIAAAIYYHCSMTISLGVMTIIFESLELRDIF
jgi:hypothetical protein